jgi:hypothetical protein
MNDLLEDLLGFDLLDFHGHLWLYFDDGTRACLCGRHEQRDLAGVWRPV